MLTLDNNQIELIKADVKSARITLENLSHELVDHICCEVEELMSNGKSFEEAYALVKEQAGIPVLQKIQENTLYLIDKNYALMKTTMKITGNVALALLGMGTVFKIFHWPGASMALQLGFILLCFVFFPSAIYLNHKEFKAKGRTALNISILIGGIILMIGILFKVMHWPGSSLLLFVGWTIVVGIFLPLLLYVKIKEVDTKKEKRVYALGIIALMIFEVSTMFKMFHWPGTMLLMLLGSVLLVSFFLPMYASIHFKQTGKITGKFIFVIITSMYAIALTVLLAFNVSTNVLQHFVNDASNSSKIINYFEKKNKLMALSDSVPSRHDSLVSVISANANNIHLSITNIQLNLIQTIEGVDEQTAKNCIEHPEQIMAKNNYDLVNIILLGQNGEGIAKSLKLQLDNFREKAIKLTSTNPELSNNIAHLLNTATTSKNSSGNSWEEINFRNKILIAAIAQLRAIEKNVRVVESTVLSYNQTKK